jgi:hypothetical protein
LIFSLILTPLVFIGAFGLCLVIGYILLAIYYILKVVWIIIRFVFKIVWFVISGIYKLIGKVRKRDSKSINH